MERTIVHPRRKQQKPPRDRNRTDAMPANNRSAVTNGTRIGAGIDLRTSSGRRWRDLFYEYLEATGGKHETLVRQLASLIVARERMDASLANGDDVDALDLVRVVGAINRTMTRLGLVADGEDEPADATADAIAALRAAT